MSAEPGAGLLPVAIGRPGEAAGRHGIPGDRGDPPARHRSDRGYVFSGRTGGTLRAITGAVGGAFLGVDAVGLGDVNADGLHDYLLTTFNDAYVVAGTPLGGR